MTQTEIAQRAREISAEMKRLSDELTTLVGPIYNMAERDQAAEYDPGAAVREGS